MSKKTTRRLELLKEQVITGYNNGETLESLAKLYEISPATLRIFLIKHNVEMRKRGRRMGQRVSKKNVVLPESLKEVTA